MKQITEREAVAVNNLKEIAVGMQAAILVILMQLSDGKMYTDVIPEMSLSIADDAEDKAEIRRRLKPMRKEYNDTVEKAVLALTKAITALTMLGEREKVVQLMQMIDKAYKRQAGKSDWTDAMLSFQLKALDDVYAAELEKVRNEQ